MDYANNNYFMYVGTFSGENNKDFFKFHLLHIFRFAAFIINEIYEFSCVFSFYFSQMSLIINMISCLFTNELPK